MKFIEKYQPSGMSIDKKNKMICKINDRTNLEILLSILFPIYECMKINQGGDISLAQGYFSIMNLYDILMDDKILLVNENGYVFEKVCVSEDIELNVHKTLSSCEVLQEFNTLKMTIANQIKKNILDKLEDDTVISCYFDPKIRKKVFEVKNRKNIIDKKGASNESEYGYESPSDVYSIQLANRITLIKTKMIERIKSSLSTTSINKDASVKTPPTSIIVSNTSNSTISLSSSSISSSEIQQYNFNLRYLDDKSYEIIKKMMNHNDVDSDLNQEMSDFEDAITKLHNLSDFDFWRNNQKKFPNLYKFWLQNRAIKVSTAQVESVFSMANNIGSDNLSNEMLDCLLILKNANLSFEDLIEFSRSYPNPGRLSSHEHI